MRRAWIEMLLCRRFFQPQTVALHAEGVDRNPPCPTKTGQQNVALHAEGVDRNAKGFPSLLGMIPSPSMRRAWIEIAWPSHAPMPGLPSPSMRRAWIEILVCDFCEDAKWSPSMRRAWIEIALSLSFG